ncbi:MAG TPA: DUF3352 domain-containing protein, partial [Phycisphaerae bacterium]|nr:DUF3352 domain-containing protein [Phycisphaerae bacterium]
MAEVDADAALTMYVNVGRVMEQIEELTKELPAEKKEPADNVIKALGLSNFTQIAVTGSFSGAEWTDKSFVGLKGEERGGLASLFAPKPIDDAMLKWVPKEATSFQVVRLDLPNLWDRLGELMKAAGPEAVLEFKKATSQFRKQFGMDLRKDVLAGLDDTMLVYNLPSTDDAEAETLFMLKLRDEKKVLETLDAVLKKLEAEGSDIGVKKEKLAGVEATIATVETKSAAWGAYKGWLVVSTPDGFERAIKQIKTGKKSILDNEKFAAARKSLGATGAAVSVDYHDPAALYGDFLKNAALLMIMANMAGAELPGNFLPDADKVEKYLSPGASVTWVDEKGSHCVSRSAMPGISLMAGQFNGGPVMMVAGVAFSAAMVAGLVAPAAPEVMPEVPKMPDEP